MRGVPAPCRSCSLSVATGIRGNFRLVDHGDRDYERRLWTAVLEAVPDRTRIIAHSYTQDQSLLYMLYGEGHARRDLRRRSGSVHP